MNALDFAKYGQLYKNAGKWNGRQIIPQEWVTKTFTRHRAIPGRIDEYYGYLFWNKEYSVKGRTYETFYCAGNGGNKIFVFKDQPLVVVVTASAYGTPYGHAQVDKMMTDYILPAIMEHRSDNSHIIVPPSLRPQKESSKGKFL
jgi:CubicO group peptidase (beta-lactamase class C family)